MTGRLLCNYVVVGLTEKLAIYTRETLHAHIMGRLHVACDLYRPGSTEKCVTGVLEIYTISAQNISILLVIGKATTLIGSNIACIRRVGNTH